MEKVNKDLARETLSSQILTARTLPEIQAAKCALQAWLQAYPEEAGMADGFEVLSHREDWAYEQQTEQPLSVPLVL